MKPPKAQIRLIYASKELIITPKNCNKAHNGTQMHLQGSLIFYEGGVYALSTPHGDVSGIVPHMTVKACEVLDIEWKGLKMNQ